MQKFDFNLKYGINYIEKYLCVHRQNKVPTINYIEKYLCVHRQNKVPTINYIEKYLCVHRQNKVPTMVVLSALYLRENKHWS